MNRQRYLMALITLSTVWAGLAHAQSSPAMFGLRRIPTPKDPSAIALYPEADKSAPRSQPVERWDTVIFRGIETHNRIARNVTRPTITPVLPKPERASGAAVIVAPGGAFAQLSMDTEGYEVAHWLADHGIAAFVLKYRVNPMPDDEQAFVREMDARMGAIMNPKGPPQPLVFEPRALEDAAQALRLVRARATNWRIDPRRVGMIGFSAGAMVTLQSALARDSAARPAFAGVIYGPMTAVTVPVDAPAMFVAIALDDPLFGHSGFGLVESWQKARRPVEFHGYEHGDHGFGVGRAGTTSASMMDQFYAWLSLQGTAQSPK